MISLAQTPPGSPSHEKAADFFLRLCISVDDEIARLDIPRNRDEVVRNTNIKDTMRLGDIQLLASFWFDLLQEFKNASNPTIAQLALKNIGSYIAWMDISLVVNDQVIGLLYELLNQNQNLNIPACECLADVISKGMLPLDKLNMLQVLNITDVLGRLELVSFWKEKIVINSMQNWQKERNKRFLIHLLYIKKKKTIDGHLHLLFLSFLSLIYVYSPILNL
jgi:exportin-T